MEQTPHSSRRLLLVGLAAVVGLILVIALVAFIFVGTSKKQTTSNTSIPTQRVASKAEANQSLNDLNATLKQAGADQAAAKAALASAENQSKVAN